ncbi:MAG: hypothetical protein E7680_04600 [Ruminococcaceae bacterium]|nr:hypothetical protein [Oscillospiraceae bacterium]
MKQAIRFVAFCLLFALVAACLCPAVFAADGSNGGAQSKGLSNGAKVLIGIVGACVAGGAFMLFRHGRNRRKGPPYDRY